MNTANGARYVRNSIMQGKVMIHPDYPAFIDTVGSLFSLRESAMARALRTALGRALDLRFAPFQKGVVQEKKSLFIAVARQVSGVSWSAREPHKVITTLKNSGDGDEGIVRALYFLCCITDEFEDLRDGLNHALGSDPVTDGSGIWRAKSELRFRHLIGGNAQEVRHKVKQHIATLNAQREDAQRQDYLNTVMRVEFDTLLDGGAVHSPSDSDAVPPGFLIAASEDKIVGRGFVENDAARFIETHSSPPCGTLSIIDIDDLTKINKVYGREVGDAVIEIIGILTENAVKNLRNRTGRCGDDTFFAVLAREDEETTKPIMERLCENVRAHPWDEVAEGLRVCVSVGVAGFKPLEPSLDMAVRAGRGMKRAKKAGGNIVATGPLHLPHSDILSPVSTLRVWS